MLHLLKPENAKKDICKYYGINVELTHDGPSCLAKKINDSCFIKINTQGGEAGHLVNPWSMYGLQVDNFVNAEINKIGRPCHEYKAVNEEPFGLYLKYLNSGKTLYYVQAERLVFDNG